MNLEIKCHKTINLKTVPGHRRILMLGLFFALFWPFTFGVDFSLISLFTAVVQPTTERDNTEQNQVGPVSLIVFYYKNILAL